MSATCIICLKTKPKMSREHVFPITIGGAWIIENVCQDCNNHMGKTIETPFNRHKGIAFFRKMLDISAEGRSVPNPFKGRHRVENTDQEVELFFDNGQVKARTVPTFFEPKMNDEGVLQGKITMSADLANNGTDWVEVYMKKQNLKGKFEVIYQNVQNSPASDLQFFMVESNDSLLPEFAKIAYEIAATLIPAYLDDPVADLFRAYLRKGKLTSQIKSRIGFRVIPTELVYEELLHAAKLQEHLHFARLIQTKGKGLFCLVKVFHLAHVMSISDCDDYLLEEEVFAINDAINRKHGLRLMVNLLDTELKIRFPTIESFQPLDGISLQFQHADSEEIPVYDHTGNQLVADIKEIERIPTVATSYQLVYPNKLSYATTWLPKLFIKELNSDTLVQISTVKFNCIAAYLNPNPTLASTRSKNEITPPST